MKKFAIFLVIFTVSYFLENLAIANIQIGSDVDYDIFVTDEYGTTTKQLINSPGVYDTYPNFSPDGKTIAFISTQSGRGGYEIWLINPDGTGLTQFTDYDTPYPVVDRPTWSADGEWIYFVSASPGDGEVWRIRTDKTELEQLTNVPGYNTQSFDLSKDGTMATFVRGVEGNGYTNKLYVCDVDFKNEVLIQPNYAPHAPRISSDGTMIAYVDSSQNIHIINTDGTNDRSIVTGSHLAGFHPSDEKLLISRSNNMYWVDLNGENEEFIATGRGHSISAVNDCEGKDPLDCGLVAHYPFDGDATDASGNGNDGQEIGGVSYVDGVSGNAVSLDGFSNGVELPNIVMDGLNDFSFSGWMKTDEIDAAIISAARSASDNVYLIHMQSPSAVNNGINMMVEQEHIATNTNVNDNEWHHLAFTRNGTTGFSQVYIDGVFRGSGTLPSGVLQVDPGGLILGREQDCLGGCFDLNQEFEGAMDEVRFYNRVLSEAEIQQLACEGKDPLECGLVAHYPFEDDGSDISGNENHGFPFGDITYGSGVKDNAAILDGEGDYYEVPHSSDFMFTNSYSALYG